MKLSIPFSNTALNKYFHVAAVLIAVSIGWLTSKIGILVPELTLSITAVTLFAISVFVRPRIGIVTVLIYCYLMGLIGRNFNITVPLGLGIDGLLVITWLAVLFRRVGQIDWTQIQTDLCALSLVWFSITVLEIANPAGASIAGWFYEMRSTTLYWLLTVPLVYLIFNNRKDLRLFLILIISFSLFGALYGIKQKVVGVNALEQQWLDSGQARTHLIWGKLRVFSFYAEAAQFGASQAHIGLVCLILALGPFVLWKRILLIMTSLVLFYGMLISGTRGAMFVLATGIVIYLILNKQIKIILIGCVLTAGLFSVLKYTYLGNSNADIARLRTSLDPKDASFQLRLLNQAKLRDYLADRPFGEGVGTIGNWGHQFNSDKYISTIEPDSYYVKVWAEYGIIGFIIWFSIMLYILGKCCGIVWRIRDPLLKQQLLALTAGFGGILVSSYGNEVMNQLPSAIITYFSWVFIFLGPKLDTTTEPIASATNE